MSQRTICQNLFELYTRALKNARITDAFQIEECIIMAKKMHRRLVELSEPGTNQDYEIEENWRKEIANVYKSIVGEER